MASSTPATLQNLRTFELDNHPLDLEEGQLAFNMSPDNVDASGGSPNIYMYVGNGSNSRVDETGEVLTKLGNKGKGWTRFSLKNAVESKRVFYGDVTIVNGRLKITAETGVSELIVPTESVTPQSGSEAGSIRWNATLERLEAWTGTEWGSSSSVFVSEDPPTNASQGDLWWQLADQSVMYISVGQQWLPVTSSLAFTAIQPGNGVSVNTLNEIETIDTGFF